MKKSLYVLLVCLSFVFFPAPRIRESYHGRDVEVEIFRNSIDIYLIQ